jgi:plastocyanin
MNVNFHTTECNAKYGQLPSSPSTTTDYSPAKTGSSNGGATHTVVVAPTQGVLRYVPFAVNASAGDTVKFMWGANNHTVTKSSALLPCNKSSDSPFASGAQNKDFVCTYLDLQVAYYLKKVSGYS